LERLVAELDALLRSGDARKAEEQVAALRESDPARHALGMAALAVARRDGAAALAHAQAAVALRPDDPVVLRYVALASLLCGDADAAELHARRAANRDEGVRSHVVLGNVLLSAGRFAPAEEAYRAALERDPRCEEALNGVGSVRARLGDPAAALQSFARAFAARPDDSSSLDNIAALYAERGWILGALALVRVTRDGHHAPEVQVALDLVQLQLRRRLDPSLRAVCPPEDTAALAASLCGATQSLPAAVQLQVARTLHDAGLTGAVETIAARLGQSELGDGDRAHLDFLLGLVAERGGAIDDAIDHYRSAIRSDPARWEAACNAVHLLLARPADEASREIPRLLDAVRPDLRERQLPLAFNEAVWLRGTGRGDEARAIFERVARATGGEGELGELAREALAQG